MVFVSDVAAHLCWMLSAVYEMLIRLNDIIHNFIKVIEKCTNFYFGTEKLPPKFLELISIVKIFLGMLTTNSFFSV